MKKINPLLLVPILAGNLYAANVSDIHDLTSLGSGVYQINFNNASKYKGFVTGDNSVLNRKWYVRYKVRFGTDWNWGSGQYGQPAQFLSNCKIFRMWNPGDVQENVVIALMGWENTAMASVEYIGEQNFRFLSGFKSILKAGTEHTFEFEYFESDVNVNNGYLKVWLDGNSTPVLDWKNLTTRKASSALKRPYNGGGIENVWPEGSTNGDNTLTVSDVVLAEGKTRAEYLANGPVPQPTIVQPKPSPVLSPLPTIGGTATDSSTIPQWFKDLLRKIIDLLEPFTK